MKKFVIIGADAAGMSAASRAKRNAPGLEVTVLEKTTDVSYSACGMPYNIAEPGRDIDDLVVRQAAVFREKQGIDLLTGRLVERIDPQGKCVRGTAPDGREFEFPYDSLLIATGARAVKPALPGFNLPGVMVLKSLADGRLIKQFLRSNPVRKVVIAGMGYIALEMAETFRSLGIEVDLVKPRPRLLPWMEETLSGVVRKTLEQHGVGLYPGTEIDGIERAGGRLRVTCPDIALDCDMVLVAIGIKPESELAAACGLSLSVDDSIAVDLRLKTSDPSVYAAGDCADAYHVVTGEKTWIPLALRANRAGWAVADNVCGRDIELPGVAGTAVFRTFDLEVARTGLTADEAAAAGFDPAQVVIESRSRAHAHPGSSPIWVYMVGDRKTGLLLGAQMVGSEGAAHRINAPAVALHSRMTVSEYSQTDLSYAPPFGPTWDPTLTAANQLLKLM
ncbi:MAG: FAD-dependent oxidoreductase [Spirochaetales bacterium]|nr:FAD-dependent oxidoreductase [Spirochaetales bacterium]